MAKIETELVERILKRLDIDDDVVSQVMEEIQTEVKDQNDTDLPPPLPPVKKQFVILVSDPHGELPKKDLVGWVLQLPCDEPIITAEERLIQATYEFNASKQGRKLPIKTIGEACENLPQRMQKEQKIWIKSKEPVLVLKTNNQIPMAKKSSVFQAKKDAPSAADFDV